MPEGDTIHRSAASLGRWLAGREITAARSAVAEVPADLLVGRTVESVDAVGKHLLVRCSGDLVVHTHMRMTGSWHVYPAGERWRKHPSSARLVLRCGDRVAVCFAAPVVELLRAADLARHPALSRLGPDVLGATAPDPAAVRARARARATASPTAGELLLDQQVVAGIGNIYRCESLFLCGVHPRTPSADLTDEQLDGLVATATRLMSANAGAAAPSRHFGAAGRSRPEAGRAAPGDATWVYRRRGRPCRRCGAPVRRELLGAQARSVYWCPTCQPAAVAAGGGGG